MKTIQVGMIGSGFAADFHAAAYRRVTGFDVRIRAVAGGSRERAEAFAGRHGVPVVYSDYQELLADPEIDVVDLCMPNRLHAQAAIEAAKAGKHIICEKPLTGYFGSREREGGGVSFAVNALEEALRSADEVMRAVRDNGVKLMYAENWVYAPSVAKAKRLLRAGGGAILDIRAEQSHSGSHARASKRWETAGGGALMILGAHPIAAVLHLKSFEGQIKGEGPIRVQSVTADMAPLTQSPVYQSIREHWLVTDWVDVETWANVVLTFTDGSKAVVTASFAALGGVRNAVDIYTSNSVIKCSMTPNNEVMAYAPDPDIFASEPIAEKLETKAGWSFASPDNDWHQGYIQEMQDFMACVAEDRQPLSDGRLARDVLEVIYSAYLSHETGKRVDITGYEEGETAL